MVEENCIFCKIANGVIPSATLYEDEDLRVILDLAPITRGHALILPKQHYKNLYELDEETASKVLIVAKEVITKMTKILRCDGYNLLQNNGEAAEQTIPHFHMHLIPRYVEDHIKMAQIPGELTEEDKNELLTRMKDI